MDDLLDYRRLNHNFHFVCEGRYRHDRLPLLMDRPQWKVHIKDSMLCCDTRNLSPRGYLAHCEIIIDLRRTLEFGILQVYPHYERHWLGLVDVEEIGLCKRCIKRMYDYVKMELDVSNDELNKLLNDNDNEIKEAFSIPEDNRWD